MVWVDGWMRGGEETDGHNYIYTYIHTYVHIYIHTYIHTNIDGWMRGREEMDGVDAWIDERGRRDGWCD